MCLLVRPYVTDVLLVFVVNGETVVGVVFVVADHGRTENRIFQQSNGLSCCRWRTAACVAQNDAFHRRYRFVHRRRRAFFPSIRHLFRVSSVFQAFFHSSLAYRTCLIFLYPGGD